MLLRLKHPKYQTKNNQTKNNQTKNNNNIRWLPWFSTAIITTGLLMSIPAKAVGQIKIQPQIQTPIQTPTGLQRSAEQLAEIEKAKRLNQQVIDLYDQRKYSSAIPVAENIVTILEKALGKKATPVANGLNNLARLYHLIGSFQKAEPLYQRALNIYQNTLGKQDPIVGTTLYNLAQLYQSMGNTEKAGSLFKLSQSILQNVVGQGVQQVPVVGGIVKNIPGSEIVLPSNSGLQKIE